MLSSVSLHAKLMSWHLGPKPRNHQLRLELQLTHKNNMSTEPLHQETPNLNSKHISLNPKHQIRDLPSLPEPCAPRRLRHSRLGDVGDHLSVHNFPVSSLYNHSMISPHTHTNIYIYTHIWCVYIYIYIHDLHIYIYIHDIYIYICISIYIYICISICVYIYIYMICTHIYIYTYMI